MYRLLALFVLASDADNRTDGSDRMSVLGFIRGNLSVCDGPSDCWWVLWRAPRDIVFVVGLTATVPGWSLSLV